MGALKEVATAAPALPRRPAGADLDLTDLVRQIVTLRGRIMHRDGVYNREATAVLRRLLRDLSQYGRAGQVLRGVLGDGLVADDASTRPGCHRPPNQAFFQALVHHTSDVILTIDEGNRIRYASPSAAELFGAGPLIGTDLPDLIDPTDRDRAMRLLDATRAGQTTCATNAWRISRADRTQLHVEASCLDLRGDEAVNALVLTLRDVTMQRHLEEELTFHALRDPLTALANRASLVIRLDQAISAQRNAGTPAAVLLIDLDDFKLINDALGHGAGDALLIAVGRRLSETVAPAGTVARLGSDEFAVLIQHAADPADVRRHAERILAAVSEPFHLDSVSITATASIGAAAVTETLSPHELLRQADLALYMAKKAGKGLWRRYEPPMHVAALRRLRLRAELDVAVTEGAFVLAFQPIVRLDSHVVVGFEALVRWRHPTRGLLPPSEFIDVAEETGIIVPIGNWVLERAIAAASHWQPLYGPGPWISVNVSARQVRCAGFVETVCRTLTAARLPPDRLILEITETQLLQDSDQVRRDLTRLRERGVRVAIDDFGTGYSSLSYLRRLPVDILKIDRSFVHSLAGSTSQAALVDSILRLADRLDLQVVAEGIEAPDDRAALVDMGCRLGQGFLFGRPVGAADATRQLRPAPHARQSCAS